MKKRVLHFFGKMDVGGAETLIMNIYRNIDRKKIQFDFVVIEKGFYDEEIYKLGGNIYILPNPRKDFRKYIFELNTLLRSRKYDIVHSHVHLFSGINLYISRKNNISIKVAHSHTANKLKQRSLKRKTYEYLMKLVIEKNSDKLLGCSEDAINELFLKSTSKSFLLRNGIDLDKYNNFDGDPHIVKDELGIPRDSFIVGHIGAFREEKNHERLIDIFSEIQNKVENAYLVLVGDGALRTSINEQIQSKNLTKKVKMVGVVSNVEKYLSIFDVFVFPSKYEGLGIALIEAQVKGIKCICSTGVPNEVDITNTVTFLSLNESNTKWAEETLKNEFSLSIENRINEYNIKNVVKDLMEIYGLFDEAEV